MSELRKSIQKLLNLRKNVHKQGRSKNRKQKTVHSQYVSSLGSKTQIRSRSNSLLIRHDQEQQNLRLYRRLAEIQGRHNSYQHPPEEEMHDRLYRLNMLSRRKIKQINDKQLQQQNSHLIERIVNIKSQRGPSMLPSPRSDRSRVRQRNIKSLILPPINETSAI